MIFVLNTIESPLFFILVVIKNKINNITNVKNPFWFEFGDNKISRHIKGDTASKYKSAFLSQFSMLYIGEKFYYFINVKNTIKKNSINNEKSLLSSLYFNQLNPIETYDIIRDL